MVAAAGDEDALALVGSATFLESYAGRLSGADILAHCARHHAAAVYRNWLGTATARCWLARARVGGAPVGYLVLAPSDLRVSEPQPTDLEIKRVYLLHRFQRRGLGEQLVATAVRYARSTGCRRLLLGVFSGNEAALAFYDRLGFRRVGERTFRVGDQLDHDYLLGLPLE